MLELKSYLARGVIRYLDGNYHEFNRLKNIALAIHKEEEYKRRCVATIGEIIPNSTKRKIYRIVN